MDEEELEQSNKVDISSFFGSIQSIDRVAKNALNSSNTSLKTSRSNLDLIKAIQASFESLRAEVQEISRYILIEQDERSKILAQREQAAAQREDDIQKGIFNAEDAREKALTDDKPFSGKNRFLEGITGGLSNIIEQNQDLIAGAGAATILGAIPFNFGGLVPGRGNADTVNAKLTPGEFVIPKDTVDSFGFNFFNDLSAKKNVKKNDYFVEGETELVDDGDGTMFYNPKDVRNYLKENNPKMLEKFNMFKSDDTQSINTSEEATLQGGKVVSGNMSQLDAETKLQRLELEKQRFNAISMHGYNSPEANEIQKKIMILGGTPERAIYTDKKGNLKVKGYSTYGGETTVEGDEKGKGLFGGLFGGNKKNENVKSDEKEGRGLLGAIGGTVDAATGNLTDFDRRGGKPFGLMRGITGSIDAMTGGLTDLDRRGGKPFGLMRGITGSIDAMTGGLTDLDRRGGKPSGIMRLATGVADAMSRNLFDFDRRGKGEEKKKKLRDKDGRYIGDNARKKNFQNKIDSMRDKESQLSMETTVSPDGSITSKGSGTFIAGEIVRPGESLSPKQRAAITMGIQMGNTYSSEIMENYNNSGGSPSKEEFDNYEKEKSKDIRPDEEKSKNIRPEEEKSKNITPERTLGEKVLNRFSFLPGINKSEKTEKMKIAGEMQDVEIGDDGFPTEDAIEKMTQGIGRKSDKKPQGLMRGIAGIADHMTGGLTDFDKRGKGILNPFSPIGNDKNVKLDKSTRPIPQNVTQPLDDEDETVILPPLSSPTPPPVETPPPAIPPSFGRSNNTTTLVGETDSSIPYIEVISNHYLSIP